MNIREYEAKTGQSVFSVENQQILGRLVGREVVTNVSMLVSHFAQSPEALRGSDYDYDEIIGLCGNIDYGFEREILEHWIVSKWLKDRLNEYGETTGDLFGLDIWGRTTSGQAICMDYIIARIAVDMGILAGQHNSWEDRK